MALEIAIQNLITQLSYFGVFAASGIVSASIIIPLPWYLIILGAVLLRLDPILTAIMCGAGSMAGEFICYNIGILGNHIANKQLKKWRTLIKYIKNYFKRYGFLTIFITAFLIFPFDLVSMIAGANRYDIKKYLIAGFLGKFLKAFILMILTIKGLVYLGYIGF